MQLLVAQNFLGIAFEKQVVLRAAMIGVLTRCCSGL